jgi:hypothetical protein
MSEACQPAGHPRRAPRSRAERFVRSVLFRARLEARLALTPLGGLLDRARNPGVTYHTLDPARLTAILPRARRLEIVAAIRDSVAASDNSYYFHNVSWYNRRHRYLPRGIEALDDLYPPNVAVIDFLAHQLAAPEEHVLLDFPCGIGSLLVYERDLGLTQVYGFDSWKYLAPATAARFLERFGIPATAMVTAEALASLPVTVLTCIGFPLTMLMESSSVWAKPSVRYVLAERSGRPASLPGFRRTGEYAGLITVFERIA